MVDALASTACGYCARIPASVGAHLDEAGRASRLLWFRAEQIAGAVSERRDSSAKGRAVVVDAPYFTGPHQREVAVLVAASTMAELFRASGACPDSS